MNILVSIYVKNNMVSITLQNSGSILMKETSKLISDNEGDNFHYQLLQGISKAMRLLRSYIENNTTAHVVDIECNNSTVIKWLEKGYVKPEYQDVYAEILETLNSIPIRYKFLYNKEPNAKTYLSENGSNMKLSGLDF